jgi:hypothetical protein
MMPIVSQGINDTCGRLTLEVWWFLLGYRSHGFHHYIAHLFVPEVVLDNLAVLFWAGFSLSTAL